MERRRTVMIMAQSMGLDRKETMQFMESRGFKVNERTYHRLKREISETTIKRIHEIAAHMRERHLERIDQLDVIQSELWQNYHLAEKMSDKISILRQLTELQVYISAYDDATRNIMELAQKQGIENEKNSTLPVISK